MIVEGYRYRFLSSNALAEAQKTLMLAMLAAEGLHGEARVRMDSGYVVDESLNTIVVDASTDIGEDIASIFTAFIVKELGHGRFLVGRIGPEVQA